MSSTFLIVYKSFIFNRNEKQSPEKIGFFSLRISSNFLLLHFTFVIMITVQIDFDNIRALFFHKRFTEVENR